MITPVGAKTLAMKSVLIVCMLALTQALWAQSVRTVPDRLLRSWDPVTFVFEQVPGRERPAAELFDEAHEHPGAYEWVDERTLQFRPSEPWPALQTLTWVYSGQRLALATLLEAPSQSTPQRGATVYETLDRIVLRFPGQVSAETIRTQISAWLAPITDGPGDSRLALDPASFAIKSYSDPRNRHGSEVVVRLPAPVPSATDLHLRLRLGKGEDAPAWGAHYRSAEAFRATALGCGQAQFPIAASGSHYDATQALRCEGGKPALRVEFSAALGELDAIAARNSVRVTPAPGPLEFSVKGKSLLVMGDFKAGVTYRMDVTPAALRDSRGRILSDAARTASSAHLSFAPRPAELAWLKAEGLVERHGAMQVPVQSHGVTHADLRVFPVDPLDRRFWPFPARPVATNDLARPPGPGEVPEHAWDQPAGPSLQRLQQHLQGLGSPAFSGLVPLAGARAGGRGLDLSRVLAGLAGEHAPGSYLLGVRDPASSAVRSWMRVQVTDLALTTVSTAGAVRFVVTSLRSALPVAGARVSVQGLGPDGDWQSFITGETDVLGAFDWRMADSEMPAGGAVMRVVVRKAADTLVLNAERRQEVFSDNQWRNDGGVWLQWTRAAPPGARVRERLLCHLFSERPVYKPGEPVHLRGWVRVRERGAFSQPGGKAVLSITGPGDRAWRVPLEFDDNGGFYHFFDEPELPSGGYRAALELEGRDSCGGFEFAKRDYVVPTLEVGLHGPDRVALDRPFELSVTGRYYAGGRVSDQPLRWRVTQFPFRFAPSAWRGFRFASAQAFTDQRALASEAVLQTETRLGADGSARLRVDPSLEASASPRRYVVEATVTGADGRTVTATRQVLGVPAVVPGIKVSQVVRNTGRVTPQVVVLGVDGEPRAGVELELRLLRREWHPQLRTGDHAAGVARYVTDAVDELVTTRKLRSAAEALSVPFEIARTGVYVLEVAVRDGLGRLHTVSSDFFVAGDRLLTENAQTWERAPGRVFRVVADKPRYASDDTARLVLQSPFMNGQALMVVEDPRGNRYRWVPVVNGSAVVELRLAKHQAPRLPVHFMLMRGRIADGLSAAALDLGRPASAGASTLLAIDPDAHRVNVALAYPATARPGDSVEVRVNLSASNGAALAGEVTLWLVDQAVLALGRERRLDPLPDFLEPRPVQSRLRDTRNDLFGFLPLLGHAGGGAGDTEAPDLLDNVTVRQKFVAVPFYAPHIQVDASGEARVQVQLPDNLTVFKLRAKAVSNDHRFGAASGAMAVRLPMVVQPDLPSFLRPGDRFEAAALVRAVDGTSGDGEVQMRLTGLDSDAPLRQAVRVSAEPTRAAFEVQVPQAASIFDAPENADFSGASVRRQSVELTVGASRGNADGSVERDAFAVTLPVLRRERVRVTRESFSLPAGGTRTIAAAPDAGDAAQTRRRLLLSSDANILNILSGGDYLLAYPYGCTEQRIARARGGLALERLASVTGLEGIGYAALARGVEETLARIDDARDARGLVAWWPGSEGAVSLTAWALQFTVAVRESGREIPEGLDVALVRTLRQALRSDFQVYEGGSALADRVWALIALADAGLPDAGYAAELARRASFLPAENLAQVMRVLAAGDAAAPQQLRTLSEQLWPRLRTRLASGQQRYLGLTDSGHQASRILPGETRALAELLRTASRLGESQARQALLRDALAGLAGSGGWGTTNANAAAMSALTEHLQTSSGGLRVAVSADSQDRVDWASANAALLQRDVDPMRPLTLYAPADGGGLNVSVQTRVRELGNPAMLAADAQGFVVRRSWYRVAAGDAPAVRLVPAEPGGALELEAGDIIEERVEVTSLRERNHVAITSPLAAGLELLDPTLATAPPEATPSAPDSSAATFIDRRLSQVAWYFNQLPEGNHVLRLRLRAQTPGRFSLPPAMAEAMYDAASYGRSAGRWVVVERD